MQCSTEQHIAVHSSAMQSSAEQYSTGGVYCRGKPPCFHGITRLQGLPTPTHPAFLPTSCCWRDPALQPQVYSGGLGSYALLVMVAAFLQLHPSRQQSGADCRRPSCSWPDSWLSVAATYRALLCMCAQP